MQGYVLGANDGEHMFQTSGEIVIKIDPTRGSNDLCLGTQRMPVGAGVPRHRHAYWDEHIYVLDGRGAILLEDERVPIQKGATIFIPKGTSHGFENPDSELFVLWAAAPTGREEFARSRASPVGCDQSRSFRSSNSDPKGSEYRPHQDTYKPSPNPETDTVIAPEKSVARHRNCPCRHRQRRRSRQARKRPNRQSPCGSTRRCFGSRPTNWSGWRRACGPT